MPSRLIEEQRPASLAAAARNPGLAFVPVSPLLEWHGPHLPLGVDGLIAEGVARELAEHFGAVYCRCLPLMLDEERSPETKIRWGLPEKTRVYGMNFPGFPVYTECHAPEAAEALLGPRLEALQKTGFRKVVVLNHHGGQGQTPTLEAVIARRRAPGFLCRVFHTARFNHHQPSEPGWELYLKAGGHAGMAETLQLMAFRPELVELSALPAGELSVAETGILHSGPRIPAELNPRLAPARLAEEWRRSTLSNLIQAVENLT